MQSSSHSRSTTSPIGWSSPILCLGGQLRRESFGFCHPEHLRLRILKIESIHEYLPLTHGEVQSATSSPTRARPSEFKFLRNWHPGSLGGNAALTSPSCVHPLVRKEPYHPPFSPPGVRIFFGCLQPSSFQPMCSTQFVCREPTLLDCDAPCIVEELSPKFSW